MSLRRCIRQLIFVLFVLSACQTEEAQVVTMKDGKVANLKHSLTYDGNGIYNYGGKFVILVNYLESVEEVSKLGSPVYVEKLLGELSGNRIQSIAYGGRAVLAIHLCQPPTGPDGTSDLTIDAVVKDPSGAEIQVLRDAPLLVKQKPPEKHHCVPGQNFVELRAKPEYPRGEFTVKLKIHDKVSGTLIPISEKLPYKG